MFALDSCQKIVVTGGAGFLGRHVVAELIRSGAKENAIVVPRSREHDLREPESCRTVTKDADLVIHLAAKVGGIGYNQKHPGELFYDNTAMGLHLIEACRESNVKKFVYVGTICSYPNDTPVPFKESDLWNGYPEVTNAPYGIAKKSMQVMLQAYREQYGMNGIYLMPVNLYGPHDNFDLESSHVIPALIRKFIAAKDKGESTVTLWGDGSPTREFLYVEDAARGIVLGTQKFESSDAVNLGSAEEISIRDLAEVIRKKTDFSGEINWDTSRPNGQPRRKLDTSKAKAEFGFESKVSMMEGIDRTIQWWRENGE